MTDRIEQAAPDVREVLEDAWRDHHGYPLECHPIEAKCPYCNKFRRFLDAEAYTDAALLLVPEGCKWAITSRNSACCNPGHIASLDWVFAETPALAIAAAALRAKGPGHE